MGEWCSSKKDSENVIGNYKKTVITMCVWATEKFCTRSERDTHTDRKR